MARCSAGPPIELDINKCPASITSYRPVRYLYVVIRSWKFLSIVKLDIYSSNVTRAISLVSFGADLHRDSAEIRKKSENFLTIALIFISRRQKFLFSVRSLRENCIEAKSNNRGFSRFESKFKHISQEMNYYTDGGGQLI